MTIDFGSKLFIVLFVVLSIVCFLKIKKNIYKVLGMLFSFYLLCLIKIVFFPIYVPSKVEIQEFKNAMSGDFSMIQYVPFKNIILTLQSSNFLIQIGGNIVLLIPFVLFTALFLDYKKKYTMKKMIIWGVRLSVIIETIQAIINILAQYPNRIADIDDIILNSIGVVLATIVYSGIRKMFLSKRLI